MNDTNPPASNAPVQPRKRRWLRLMMLVLALLVVLPLLGVFGIHIYNRRAAERALEEAIAETDRLDPGWRLEDIEKSRAVLKPEENAATFVVEATSLIPDNWTLDEDLVDRLTVPPQVQLDPTAAESLREQLDPVFVVLPFAQKTLPIKRGRFDVGWKPDDNDEITEQTRKNSKLVLSLYYLSLLKCNDSKLDEAWKCGWAAGASARSVGDEPLLMSQFVRWSGWSHAVLCFERCLAQGTVDEPLLRATQTQLLEEAGEPSLCHAIRGERVSAHYLFSLLEKGEISKISSDFPGLDKWPLWERVSHFLRGETLKTDHAWILLYLNRLVDISRQPNHEQMETLSMLHEGQSNAPILARAFIEGYSKGFYDNMFNANARSVSLLQCAQAGIAVERFRLKHKRWPESLDEVVSAGFFDKVPEDPYDGKPLRFRKSTDGVVVYSVGKDLNYAGDALDAGREYDPSIIRYEFRLWDEAHRRQPPRVKKSDN